MRIILMVFSIFLLTLNCFSQVDTFSDKYVDSIGWPDIDIIGGNDASYALKTPIPAGVDVMLSTFCNRNSISYQKNWKT